MIGTPSPIQSRVFALLLLNVLDVLVTTPAYEANPFTLYMWGTVGMLFSAWLKIGLVLLFGGLCQLTKTMSTPSEWAFSERLFKGILTALVAFYAFVVGWNVILFASVNL